MHAVRRNTAELVKPRQTLVDLQLFAEALG
jgi:hypothetical protein